MMKKRWAPVAAALLLLTLLLPACTQDNASATPSPSAATGDEAVVGVRGRITSRAQTDDRVTLLVEGEKAADTEYDSASVTVTGSTVIRTENREPAGTDDLRVNAIVEVVFAGPVAESYPVQGTASSIMILPR